MKECLGFYRRRRNGEPPAVFLIVDNVIETEEWKRRVARIHARRKCWYLHPIRKPLRVVLGGLRVLMRSRRSRHQRRHHGRP